MLWKFVLCNSNDLSHIGELAQAKSKKLNFMLNKSGSASFTYPMNALYAADISPYRTGVKALRYNRALTQTLGHAVWECLWSGYVLPIDETVDGNSMAISCVGWLQRLQKRFVRRDKTYNNQDDGAIVQDLLAEMNTNPSPGDGYAIPTPVGSNPNTPTWLTWGGTQPDEGVGGATAYKSLLDPSMGGVGRNKSVVRYTPVLSVIEELNNIENGGDIVVDPETRSITWHRRYRRVKDDVVFGFQWGPHNARAFSRNIEADSQINYMVVTGAGGTTPGYADDPAQQSAIGLLEETAALSDVRDNNILLTYAGAEIIVRSNGHISYGVTPFPVQFDKRSNVVEPFIDYRLGDQVRLTAVHPPRVNIRGQAIRIFGFSIDIDDNGIPTIGPLQVAP